MTSLPDYAAALEQALRSTRPLERIEEIPLSQADGRLLAAAIQADRDLPPFNRSQMDGYAIRHSDFSPKRPWIVAASVAAGMSADVNVPPGECAAIATGAPLPPGLDTVIPHEWSDRGDRAGRPVHFTVDTVARGHAVHPRGADAKQGQTLLQSGTRLGPQHLGIIAAVGLKLVTVRARPRVAILTSGDEVVPSGAAALPHQIRNSNAPMIASAARRMGGEVVLQSHVADDARATADAVAAAMRTCDLLITVGGVSAGDRDFFPQALQTRGVAMTLHGAAIQPGKPVMVGRSADGVVAVSLPGNPVSALACACLFAWPAIRVMSGLDPELPWRMVELAMEVKPNPHRRAFRPAALQADGRAFVPKWAGSGDLVHTAATDGLLELPIQGEAAAAGLKLRFLPWP